MNPTLTNYIKTCDDQTFLMIKKLVTAESNYRGEIRASKEDEIRLTVRQKDVLKLCCFGKKEIAKKLHLQLSTIQTHLNGAYNNLWTSNKTEAIIKALKLGIIKLNEVELP